MNEQQQLEAVQALHRTMWGLFDYQHDERTYQQIEHWRSHADAVLHNERFTDDCDGYAWTACEILLEEGFSPSNVLFIVCKTELNEGHAVCGVNIGADTYIVDNRFKHVYKWTEREDYQWDFKMSLDQPGQWYVVTNG